MIRLNVFLQNFWARRFRFDTQHTMCMMMAWLNFISNVFSVPLFPQTSHNICITSYWIFWIDIQTVPLSSHLEKHLERLLPINLWNEITIITVHLYFTCIYIALPTLSNYYFCQNKRDISDRTHKKQSVRTRPDCYYYWCLQDTYMFYKACFQKSTICAEWIAMNCNWHREVVTSHAWRWVFADTNNLWLTV